MRLRLAAFGAALLLGAAAATASPPRLEPSRAVGATHNCAEYYPDASRRLSESGDVLISYDVAADGAVSNVKVIKSSGSGRLDLAAVLCVTERWRNTPATRDGVAVASPGHKAIIRFVLRGADGAPALETWRLLLWSVGTLAVVGFAVIGLRQWMFRVRACPNCHAGNRNIVPFVAPGYCSKCGARFA